MKEPYVISLIFLLLFTCNAHSKGTNSENKPAVTDVGKGVDNVYVDNFFAKAIAAEKNGDFARAKKMFIDIRQRYNQLDTPDGRHTFGSLADERIATIDCMQKRGAAKSEADLSVLIKKVTASLDKSNKGEQIRQYISCEFMVGACESDDTVRIVPDKLSENFFSYLKGRFTGAGLPLEPYNQQKRFAYVVLRDQLIFSKEKQGWSWTAMCTDEATFKRHNDWFL
jgi:hypothetical protein